MKSQAYQVELSRDDYVVGLSALMGELARLDTARGRLLLARLAVTVAALAVVTLVFPKSLPGLLAAGLMIWLGDWLVRTAFTTQSVGVSFDPAAHSSMRVEFSDDGVVEEGELRTRRWTWDAVRRVHLSPGYVILELKGWDMIVLPGRLWPSAEERSAFVAEIEARRLSGEAPTEIPPAAEAQATVILIEPVLLARIALAVGAYQLIFEGRLRAGAGLDPNALYISLGLALVAAAVLWWTSGKAFGWLAGRSATAALRTAQGLFGLLAAAFVLWFLGLV